jgi:hypothetical protein
MKKLAILTLVLFLSACTTPIETSLDKVEIEINEFEILMSYIERRYSVRPRTARDNVTRYIKFTPNPNDPYDLDITVWDNDRKSISIAYNNNPSLFSANRLIVVASFQNYGSNGRFEIISSKTDPDGNLSTGGTPSARYNFTTGRATVSNFEAYSPISTADQRRWNNEIIRVVEFIIAPELVKLLQAAGLPPK